MGPMATESTPCPLQDIEAAEEENDADHSEVMVQAGTKPEAECSHPSTQTRSCIHVHPDWAKLHVHPDRICIAFSTSSAAMLMSVTVILGLGIPWLTRVLHIPLLLFTSASSVMAAMIWWSGPKAATGRLYGLVTLVMITSGMMILLTPFVGPERLIPFGNRLATVVSYVFLTFACNCAGSFGASAADHPASPYKSLLPPMEMSAYATLRTIDVLADLGVVRILWVQGPDCTWFGEEVPCAHFTRLAIIAAAFCSVRMALTVASALVWGKALLVTSAGSRFRYAVLVNVAYTAGDLGSILVVLLTVFSSLRAPESADRPRLRREAAFAFVSVAVTLAGCCTNLLGTARVLRGVRAAAQSVRRSVRVASSPGCASRAAIAPSTNGQGSERVMLAWTDAEDAAIALSRHAGASPMSQEQE